MECPETVVHHHFSDEGGDGGHEGVVEVGGGHCETALGLEGLYVGVQSQVGLHPGDEVDQFLSCHPILVATQSHYPILVFHELGVLVAPALQFKPLALFVALVLYVLVVAKVGF